VLEFEVVTPQGDIVIANKLSHPDLFWALRGGGASTYGVATKVTYKTYPQPKTSLFWVAFSPTAPDFDSFYNALAYWYSKSPSFNDFGISGYPVATRWGYIGVLFAPEKTDAEVQAFFAPLRDHMAKSWNIKLNTINMKGEHSLELSYWSIIKPADGAEPSNQFYTMASRLVARSAMTESNLPAIFKFVKQTLDDDVGVHLPYPNMPGIAKRDRDWDFALNPAWRDATIHMIVLNNEFDDWKQIPSFYDNLRDTVTELLDPLSQNHAAYINEVRSF
jgi:FAD/FMN-containing dehydrogenase